MLKVKLLTGSDVPPLSLAAKLRACRQVVSISWISQTTPN